ncbi:unnamed protein product [Effrenium voratum]|nr:unnamed protein product [Effrenium voratum]
MRMWPSTSKLPALKPATRMMAMFLHALAAGLAFLNAQLVLRRLGADARVWCALAAAFIGGHPLRAEVVCWPSCHGYLLATVFCLLSMRCCISGWYKFECLFLGAALLCKAAAVSFPAVLWALDVVLAEKVSARPLAMSVAGLGAAVRQLWRLPLAIAAFAAVLAAESAPADARLLNWSETVSAWHFDESVLAVDDARDLEFKWQCLCACKSAEEILISLGGRFPTAWRWHLGRSRCVRSAGICLEHAEPRFAFSVAFVFAAALAPLVCWTRSAHCLWFAWISYLGLLLPTLGLVSTHVWALAADRYAYLPSMCVLIPCLAMLLHRLSKAIRPVAVVAGAGCLVILCAWRADEVASYWSQGSLPLLEVILRENPGEFNTLKDLGTLHLKQGSYGQAKAALAHALRLRPDHSGTLLNLATLLHQSKATADAEAMYRRACAASKASVAQCQGCQPAATELAKAQASFARPTSAACSCSPTPRSNLGSFPSIALGRAAEAASILEAGAPWENAVDSARAPGLFHLCLAYRALKRHEDAARLCRASAAAKGARAAEAVLAQYETEVEAIGIR